MIYLDHAQGSPEWLEARLGVITASIARDALEKTSKGVPTVKAIGLAARIGMELVTRVSCDDTFVNAAMRRGSKLEPQARIAYESASENLVEEVGFYMTDDRAFGYSSDGVIDSDGLIEIKCPTSPLTVISMWRDGDLTDYMHQIQMGLWLTGRKWLHFVMYDPRLASVGKSLFIKRVQRNEAFIEKMEADLLKFSALVREFSAVIQRPQLLAP